MNPNLKILSQTTASPDQAVETIKNIFSTSEISTLAPLSLTALIRVFGNSPFLARWGKNHPEWIHEIISTGFQKTLHPTFLKSQISLPSFIPMNREHLAKTLTDFKYRQLFRIALRDFSGAVGLPVLLKEWSDVARIILQAALNWHQDQLEREFGKPVLKMNRATSNPFLILAMGKLGGEELNYSSDIDIQFLYGSDESVVLKEKAKQEISSHQFFSKLSQRLSLFFQQKTVDGFLYRVDLELRPEGKSGPITNSLDGIEVYYESFGAPWERQALIKAAWCGGEVALFEEFQKRLTPFTYPKTADFSFIEYLGEMKEKIVQQILSKFTESFHVKLGDGGIREIEFFVQALQHLFGGNIEDLRTTNTLQALHRLEKHQLISPQEQADLSQAYLFLRNLENRLQLIEEQQTHQLPSDEEEIGQLARRMGYSEDLSQAIQRFHHDLERHRQKVKLIFGDLLNTRFKKK